MKRTLRFGSFLLRIAPISTLVVASAVIASVGASMGLRVDQGFGVVWRFLIIPWYLVALLSTVVAQAVGAWAGLPVFVATLVAADGGIFLLRRSAERRNPRE